LKNWSQEVCWEQQMTVARRVSGDLPEERLLGEALVAASAAPWEPQQIVFRQERPALERLLPYPQQASVLILQPSREAFLACLMELLKLLAMPWELLLVLLELLLVLLEFLMTFVVYSSEK
jgi:hypothetical protein